MPDASAVRPPCRSCGAPLTGLRADARACSISCRSRLQRQREAAELAALRADLAALAA